MLSGAPGFAYELRKSGQSAQAGSVECLLARLISNRIAEVALDYFANEHVTNTVLR